MTEGVVVATWVHQVKGGGVEGTGDAYGVAIVAADVEHQALAVSIAAGLRQVEGDEAVGHTAAAPPTQVAREDGRQRGQGHVATEVEARVGVLIVAARGAVAPIVGVLLQGIDAVGGRHVGGIAHKAGRLLVVLADKDDLLAPVAHDVAHEGRPRAGAAVGCPVALLRELGQSCLVEHLRDHHVGAPSAAAGRRQLLALQVAVPPESLEHGLDAAAGAGVGRLLAMAVVDIVVGEAVELVALARGVDIHAGTAADVEHGGQVPLLDALSRAGVVEQLAQQGALLYGIDLQAGAVGVDVAQDEAVAMTNAGTGKPAGQGVHRVAALHHLVAAVAIDVGHAQLVKLGRPRRLVVTAPRGGVVPPGRPCGGPVVVPGEDIVMVGLVGGTVEALHDQRGVYAVEVADGEVAVHGGIAVAHVVGTVVAGVSVYAVVHLAVVQLAAGYLRARLAVDDGDVEGAVAHRLLAVVHDAVAIGVGRLAVHGVEAPRLVLLVPEAGAVARLDDDLATSVAVDVVGYDHVVLSAADVHVRPHVDGPQQFAGQPVSLQFVARGGIVVATVLGIVVGTGTGKQTVAHHGVDLAVAVEVHGPDELRAVVVTRNDGVVEREREPHVGPRLTAVEEGRRQRTLDAGGRHGGHGVLGVVGQRLGHVARRRERFVVQPHIVGSAGRASVDVVGGALRLLGQFAPRDEVALSAGGGDRAATRAVDGYDAASRRLLQALGNGVGLLGQHQCNEQTGTQDRRNGFK